MLKTFVDNLSNLARARSILPDNWTTMTYRTLLFRGYTYLSFCLYTVCRVVFYAIARRLQTLSHPPLSVPPEKNKKRRMAFFVFLVPRMTNRLSLYNRFFRCLSRT